MAAKAVGRCTECRAKLVYDDGVTPKPAGTKTCGLTKCRSARARRLKREEKARGGDKRARHIQEVSDTLKGGDALHDAAVEEFRPLVREAMTEDVLRGIDTLIGLSPAVMAALEADIRGSDEVIRQRAYTLWFRYTMGNPSVAPPSQQAAPGGLTVQFNIPRPGDDPTASAAIPAQSEALRTCDDCSREQPESSFVAGSNRCQECFGKMSEMLVDALGEAYKQ